MIHPIDTAIHGRIVPRLRLVQHKSSPTERPDAVVDPALRLFEPVPSLRMGIGVMWEPEIGLSIGDSRDPAFRRSFR